jgi:Peptidase A4 family
MTAREPTDPRVPYRIVSTDLPGVFISPAPPPDFDPNTASRESLIKNGILWRRPETGDHPALRAAWERGFSRQWRAEDRLVPQFEPQIGKTHNLRDAQRQDDGTYTSPQWSGSVVQGNWIGAIGYWAIPAVFNSGEPQGTEGGWNSSSWVGIDGALGSKDVLQAGVEQQVSEDGLSSSYTAWFEWYVKPYSGAPGYVWQVNIPNFPVEPSQTVFCGVLYVNHTAGYVCFANETTGHHFSTTMSPPEGATFSGNTAEWIMEAPDGGEPVSSLPEFTPVVFTSAICCGPDQTYGNPASASGNIFNIVGFNTTLTSVTTGQDTVTIDYAGPFGGGGGQGGGEGDPQPGGPHRHPDVRTRPGPQARP